MGGISKHGTGDLSGYTFLNQVDIKFEKFFLSPGIQFTNNSKTYILSSGLQLNFVTEGVNVFTNINYLILNKTRHRIAIGAGLVLRFVSSSYSLEFGTNLNVNNEQELLLKNDKLRSVSVGYNVTPSYYYQINTRLFLGAKFIFQNDTKGDAIS